MILSYIARGCWIFSVFFLITGTHSTKQYGLNENPKEEDDRKISQPKQTAPNSDQKLSYILFGPQNHIKRSPTEMGARGFHEGVFTNNFGSFSPVKRNKRYPNFRYPNPSYSESDSVEGAERLNKIMKRLEMGMSGFHGDTFSNGFGEFNTMKKNNVRPYKRMEMGSSGFHGDTFNSGFGDFYTMKRNFQKRRPEMDSSGFFGDTFSGGFGDFYTMKRNSPYMNYANTDTEATSN